jgi:hypothetical protein
MDIWCTSGLRRIRRDQSITRGGLDAGQWCVRLYQWGVRLSTEKKFAPAPLHTFGHNFKGPIHFGLFPSHALEKASPQLHVLHAQAHINCNILWLHGTHWHELRNYIYIYNLVPELLCGRYRLVRPTTLPTCNSYNNNNILKLIYNILKLIYTKLWRFSNQSIIFMF